MESQIQTDQGLSTILKQYAEGRYQAAIDELQASFSAGEMSPKLHLLKGKLLFSLGRKPGYFQEYREEIWVVPAAGGEPQQLAMGGSPCWAG